MKIESIYHSKESRRKECKGDQKEKKFSKDPVHHPMLLEREYIRALNSTKIERLLAKPFVTALSYHREGINKLYKEPNNNIFMSSSYDNKVILWDLYSKKIIQEKQYSSIINGIAVDSNSNMFVTQEKCVFLNGNPHFNLDSTVTSIDFSKDLCVGTSNGISIFDANKFTPKISYELDDVTSVKFNRSFEYILCGLTNLAITLFDNRSNKDFLVVETAGTNCVAFNDQKGFQFACGNENGDAYLYDLRNAEKPIETFRGHTNAIVSVSFNPNGQEIATGSFDRTIRIFKTDERKPRDCYYNDRMQIVHAIEYSNDGEFIISGSDDGSLRIWKAKASKKIGPMTKAEKESMQYTEALKDKFKYVGDVSRISKHRFLNKEIKKEMRIKHEMYEGAQRRADKKEKEKEFKRKHFPETEE